MSKLRPNVLTWDDITNTDDNFPSADPNNYHNKILAEGDSWFTLAGIPTSNLLFELRFPKPTLIVNVAYPGDTLINMAKLSKNDDFKSALKDKSMKWDAILLSAGGNDLVDHANKLLLNKKKRKNKTIKNMEDYCNQIEFNTLLKNINQGFKKISKLRDKIYPNKKPPIITHTYSYATPRNSPARFFGLGFRGPWIYKAFKNKDIPQNHWLELSDYLLDRLSEGHIELTKQIKGFYVVDTRKTLTRAALGTHSDDADWLNEFHPNSEGYKKMAKAVEPILNKLIK